METRYYSDKPGPTGEYKLALHASKKVFDRIKGHLERKSRIQEELDKEANYKKYLRDVGKAMTDKWENSVENIRKKKQEAREQRLAQTADDRVEQYYKVLRDQAEERKIYNEKVKEKIFKTRGAQRAVNSGVLLTECLYINDKLIELKNREKEKDRADWKAYEDKILREDQQHEENELVKQCRRRTINGRHLDCLKQQVADNRKKQEDELKLKLEEESTDIIRQQEEMESIQKNAHEDFLKAKRSAIKTLKESREWEERKRRSEKKEDAEMAIVCKIFNDTRTKINCRREKQRKEDIQARIDFQKGAFKRLEDIQRQLLDNEEKLIANAVAEYEEIENKKRLAKEEYTRNLIEERKQNYQNALEKVKKQKEMEKEGKKWATFNRVKLMEVQKEKEIQKQEEKVKGIEKLREMWDIQVEDNEKRKLAKKEKENAFVWNDYPERDRAFLEYAAETLAERKAKERITYPVEVAIMEYKKTNLLLNKDVTEGKRSEKNEKDERKLPLITRRICPDKNDSSGVRDCFCLD